MTTEVNNVTEAEREFMRNEVDNIQVKIKAYLGKFSKKYKYEAIDLETNKMFLLQTEESGLGFEMDKCYTVPILQSKTQFKNIADKCIELIYPIDEETMGLIDNAIAAIPEPIVIKPVEPPTEEEIDAQIGFKGQGKDIRESPNFQRSQLAIKNKFEVMDSLDEDQIIDEMKGKMIEEYVYQFMQGGVLVTGIAYAGIKHITSRRGGYEDIEFKVAWNEEFQEFEAWIKIRDNTNGNTAIGLAYQSKDVYSKKQNRLIPNKFAKLMAYSKARRNGLRTLMDEAPIKIFVAKWLKENKK